MTVAAAAAKAGPYTGNDVTSSFAFSFKVFADADIRVVETLISTSVETDLVLNTNYTVARNVDQDASPGGTITYKVGGVTTALPSTKKLTIVGDFDYEQPTDIPNGGPFLASVIETAFDRVTMLIKQVKERVDRAVTVDVSSDTDPDALIASLEASEAAAAASAVAAASSAAAAEAAIPSGSLGYTPVDVAGDTMTGPLLLPSINLGGSGAYTSFGNVVTKTHGTASGNVPLVGTKSATTALAGLVEQSTSVENLAGTDDTVFPSVAGVKEMIDRQKSLSEYDSGDQTITTAGALTLAHGLAAAPKSIQTLLKCTTAEHGFSIGDYLFIDTTGTDNGATGSVPTGVSIVPDATNLNVRFANFSAVFRGLHKTTGAQVSFTNTSWAFVVRAFL